MFPVNTDQEFQSAVAALCCLAGIANGSVGGLEIHSNKEIITQCGSFQAVSNPNRASFGLAGISGSKESWAGLQFSWRSRKRQIEELFYRGASKGKRF